MRAATIADAQFQALAQQLRSYAGLAFAPSRHRDLVAAIQRGMSSAGIADIDAFIQRLAVDQQMLDAFVAQVTVGETYFFREPEQFDWLRRHILPVLGRREPIGTKLRIWCAGCASGEEPYTAAIVLAEEGLADRSFVLGTDISRPALARASDANFSEWSMRATSPAVAAQYFRRHGDRYALDERIRERVTFAHLNLAADSYPSYLSNTMDLDVIFCRNVLIYLDEDTTKKIAGKFFAALRSGGWLITGPSDPPLWSHAPFETVVTPAGVLYRRGEGYAAVVSTATLARCDEIAATSPFDISPPAPSVPLSPPRAETLDDEAWVSRVRALADRGNPDNAEREAVAALRAYPLNPELHYLHAIILVGLGRYDDAVIALRRVLYLDRSLAIAHFTLATIMRRQGALEEARRAYRSAFALCSRRPEDEIVPFSGGERCDRLAAAARTHLDLLETREVVS